jgi:hypothetical protein
MITPPPIVEPPLPSAGSMNTYPPVPVRPHPRGTKNHYSREDQAQSSFAAGGTTVGHDAGGTGQYRAAIDDISGVNRPPSHPKTSTSCSETAKGDSGEADGQQRDAWRLRHLRLTRDLAAAGHEIR